MRYFRILLAALCTSLVSHSAFAQTAYTWVDWVSATTGLNGTASGSAEGVDVTYSGEIAFAQTQPNQGTNFWIGNKTPVGTSPYTSALVLTPPPGNDIITLAGPSVNKISFTQAVTNPIMAILSLGREGSQYDYNFDQAFTILSSGRGYWGGASTGSLTQSGMTLTGNEGHGTIQFLGTFNEISWQASPTEFWHGVQVAIPVPEPETYALMLAGLGLMGFVGTRRRKSLRAA